jgi:Fe2+ or Zn2+ uptake regulation protein
VTPRAAQEGEAMPNLDPEPRTQDDVRETLREHGLRYSRPRAAILGFFAEEDRHVSAEDLYVELKRRGEHLSLSTVYLNLHVLSDAGVVREFQGSEGQRLYDSNVTPHYHLICKETGEVRDVPAPTVDGVPLGRFLKQTIEAATGWEVEEPQVQLRGRSPRARAAGPEDEAGGA